MLPCLPSHFNSCLVSSVPVKAVLHPLTELLWKVFCIYNVLSRIKTVELPLLIQIYLFSSVKLDFFSIYTFPLKHLQRPAVKSYNKQLFTLTAENYKVCNVAVQ